MVIIQPSASRTTTPLAPFPSSKLLGYYHSSALRTDKSTFWAKPRNADCSFVADDSISAVVAGAQSASTCANSLGSNAAFENSCAKGEELTELRLVGVASALPARYLSARSRMIRMTGFTSP